MGGRQDIVVTNESSATEVVKLRAVLSLQWNNERELRSRGVTSADYSGVDFATERRNLKFKRLSPTIGTVIH